MSRHAASPHYHKTLDNKYMLGDEIGKGAYGRVYKALDLANGDFVAVKQVSLNNIDQEDLNSIMQEIDLLKNLNHINIVKYLGSVKTKSDLHIVLEFVENGSLADIIKPNKFGPFPESLVAVYIAQVLEGLVYLHEQGVIHRDIKGANILTTKEGLVKLADFGVATKLTEADTTSHSVVGTPYWMAPEVILLSGVCAASDIWSVGCTVIELLTCIPPYYDLVPMTALFKIVQDEHPPIPESLSPNITDFLCQCFKKDARHRPDAKTLLSHPWIQNYRRELQSSIRQSRTLRDVQADVSMGEKLSNADIQSSDLSSAEETEGATSAIKADFRKELLSNAVSDGRKYREDPASDVSSTEENADGLENDMKDQAPSLGIHEKSEAAELDDQAHMANDEPPSNGEVKSPTLVTKSVTKHGKRNSIGFRSSGFGARNQGGFPEKASKVSVIMGGNDLSKFSDTPGDASLDDLFHPLDKHPDHRATEASTSPSISQANQGNTMVNNAGKCDLATKLRATIAQKQMESGMDQANGSGGKLYQLMMGVLRDEVIDTGGLVFDENFSGENLFPLQAVEFSRLVGSLKIDESEDVVVSSCQKLIAMFHQHPEQKVVFVTQHGFLPLMELLEVLKTRVICSVLQIINQIIKDNTDFQENACHVGLIPVVMSFAVPSHSREIRMEAAYFLQQLCQSSSLTLQMFIACRGIPVLVGFLEADYAKFREMVHLAIDGMWQVFKLQQSTLRNDFCRIAAKNGILLRLINTLYSLNEATHLASISDGGAIPLEGPAHRPRSGLLDPGHPTFAQSDGPLSEHNDHSKTRHGVNDSNLSNGAVEPARASTSNSHLEANHSDPRYLHQEADRPRSSNAVVDDLVTSKLHESTSTVKVVVMSSKDTSTTSQGDLDLRKQHDNLYLHISATDRHPKMVEGTSNGLSATAYTQHEQVRPLLSLLDKEPPSRHVSGQLEYVHHLPMLERHESRLPFIQASNEKKTNGELDFIMAEFADVSQQGSEKGNLDSTTRIPPKTVNKEMGILASNKISASISGVASQTASGVLSRSGVLNARPGSATSSGVLSHMVSTLNADVAKGYLEKVSDLLLEFARAETIVKSFMCSQSLLCRLFQMFNRVEPPILLKILKCVNHLSTDPNCLENLQRADAIKYLTPNLELKEGSLVPQIHHEVLNALFNLCKINKRRQEQAAANGIIPHLMHFIESNSPLKQYALPLLCDMAHASRNSREQVRAHGGLDVYLSLLEDEPWSVTALDSIAVCLAHDNDNRKVEQALLKKDAVQKLVKFFQCCPEQYFVHILEPFLKMITRSSQINTALAVNGLTPLLITRLDHQDAIARLNLLKLIKAVYEHHPQPKQLIVENNLPQKLQNLIEERSGQSSGGQVLVKQMATSLLKALHINTVL